MVKGLFQFHVENSSSCPVQNHEIQQLDMD